MTTTLIPATPVPAKTEAMSWEDFGVAIKSAVEAEEARLLAEFPTPPFTTEHGSDGWMKEWSAQRDAGYKRDELQSAFNAKLVAAVAEALADAVPNFEAFRVEYSGSGDSGEDCVLCVDIKREPPTHEVIPYEGAKPRFSYTNEENQAWLQAEKDALALLPRDLSEWIDETCWALAYQQHPGFEIDGGGFGNITASRNAAGEMKLVITHTNRIEDFEEFQPQELG